MNEFNKLRENLFFKNYIWDFDDLDPKDPNYLQNVRDFAADNGMDVPHDMNPVDYIINNLYYYEDYLRYEPTEVEDTFKINDDGIFPNLVISEINPLMDGDLFYHFGAFIPYSSRPDLIQRLYDLNQKTLNYPTSKNKFRIFTPEFSKRSLTKFGIFTPEFSKRSLTKFFIPTRFRKFDIMGYPDKEFVLGFGTFRLAQGYTSKMLINNPELVKQFKLILRNPSDYRDLKYLLSIPSMEALYPNQIKVFKKLLL